MKKKFGSIPTGQLSADNNVRQAFAMTEEGLGRLNKSIEDTDTIVADLNRKISSDILTSVATLDPNSSSLADVINSLTTLSKKLKEL